MDVSEEKKRNLFYISGKSVFKNQIVYMSDYQRLTGGGGGFFLYEKNVKLFHNVFKKMSKLLLLLFRDSIIFYYMEWLWEYELFNRHEIKYSYFNFSHLSENEIFRIMTKNL